MRRLVLVDALGDAEVDELHLAPVRQHQVVGLDVAVDDPVRVRHGEGPADLPDDLESRRPRRSVPVLQVVAERVPVDELHREVVGRLDLPEVVDLDDVRVVQPRRGAGLLEEALDEAGSSSRAAPRASSARRPARASGRGRGRRFPIPPRAELLQDLVVAEPSVRQARLSGIRSRSAARHSSSSIFERLREADPHPVEGAGSNATSSRPSDGRPRGRPGCPSTTWSAIRESRLSGRMTTTVEQEVEEEKVKTKTPTSEREASGRRVAAIPTGTDIGTETICAPMISFSFQPKPPLRCRRP